MGVLLVDRRDVRRRKAAHRRGDEVRSDVELLVRAERILEQIGRHPECLTDAGLLGEVLAYLQVAGSSPSMNVSSDTL